MTTLLERPDDATRSESTRSGGPPSPRLPAHLGGTLRVAALVLAALPPFHLVFATTGWLVPLVVAALGPVALSWVLRRLRAPWWVAVPAVVVAWLWYGAWLLWPSTLVGGLVPTATTFGIMVDAAAIGIERIAVLPAPVFPEKPLLLIAVSGVWWVAVSIDTLALRLRSPGKAVVCAVTLWVVPLAIVPDHGSSLAMTAPLLLAAVALMLADADRALLEWGEVVRPARGYGFHVDRRPVGLGLAVTAVVLGGIVAGLLPGFGDPPWYRLQAEAATTLTDNPIVQIRTNLVAEDTGPILRVRSERPVYLRSTALDQYSASEQWTASEIRPRPLDGERVPGGVVSGERNEVRVDVVDLSNAVLVPTPTGPLRFDGPDGVTPLYDSRTSTFTFDDDTLDSGHRYQVVASTPQLPPDVVRGLDTPAPSELTALPDTVPPQVRETALEITGNAGATTPLEQALAIQNELRTWDYSLQPPPGHGGVAMETFLENRVGYCEQFAGTMAVMLRTLDIPARVAVGFTPGTVDPDDPTLWTVTWANSHAWVEVLFDGQWIAFEPTPRSDGNVLVPTAADLAPVLTADTPDETSPTTESDTDGSGFDLFDERAALQNADERLLGGGAPIAGAAGDVSRRLADPTFGGSLAAAALAALAVLIVLGRRASGDTSPAARVLAVGARIDRLGRGMGLAPGPAETDTEYLRRLGDESRAGHVVADALTRARYAQTVDADLARRAEHAGRTLTTELLGRRPRWQHVPIRVRGDAAAGWQRLRALAGRRPRRPGRTA